MIVRSGEERNCGKFLFVATIKPTIIFVGLLAFLFNGQKMARTAAPPDSAEMLNPAPPHPMDNPAPSHPMEILTDSQPGLEEDEDEAPMFPNQYVDIDD